MQTISASKFKATCLALLDDVAASGAEIVITKRGRPVAKVVPVEEPADVRRSLRGSAVQLVSDEELIAPIEDWDLDPKLP